MLILCNEDEHGRILQRSVHAHLIGGEQDFMAIYDCGVVDQSLAHLVDEPAHHLLLSTVLRHAVLHLSFLFISTNHVSVRRAPQRMRILCDGDEQGRPLLRKSPRETLPQKEESMLISQDVMHALISPPLRFTPLLSTPLTGGGLPALGRLPCPLWDASLCSTMRMGGMRVSDAMRLARHGHEPEIDLWAGDALPSTVLLLCILVKGSTTQHHSCESALSRSTPSGQTQTSKTYPCHRTHAKCP